MRGSVRRVSKILDLLEEVIEEIRFRGHIQKFLPQPNLDFVTRRETIESVIAEDIAGGLTQQEKAALVEDIYRKGRRMFITCVFGGLPMLTLRALLNHGLDDTKFPFGKEDCPPQENPHKARAFRMGFLDHQVIFKAAFFHLSREQSVDNDMPKPIEYNEDSVLGRGAFGEVVKIKIPESQRDFSSGANKKGQFAMKITRHENTREEPFHHAMAALCHHHVVKCLSSFIHSSKYYMIYEKADCNVEEFMKTNRRPKRLPDMTADNLGQQLFGLADGLSFVHNKGRSDLALSNSALTVPGQEPQKTAYLHDIKPENLLMFVYEQPDKKIYWIRLSDFSCAKVVDLVASVSGQHRHSWRTMSKSGTPIYRAPETSGTGGSSRPYDLWSLGCVYLELLLWYLDGYDALHQFRESRTGLVCPNGIEDEGVCSTKEGGKSARYELRPSVVEKMEDLSRRCKGLLKLVADIVSKLLQTEPKGRPTASELVDMLKKLDLGQKLPVEISLSGQESDHSYPPSPRSSMSSDSDFDFSFIKVQNPTT